MTILKDKDFLDINNWPSIEEIYASIAKEGSKYTARVWQLLQSKKLTLNTEVAERYHYIQKEHIRLTGHSLPNSIKGAIKTRAQIKNELGKLDENKVEKVVKSGLAARLAKMRSK